MAQIAQRGNENGSEPPERCGAEGARSTKSDIMKKLLEKAAETISAVQSESGRAAQNASRLAMRAN